MEEDKSSGSHYDSATNFFRQSLKEVLNQQFDCGNISERAADYLWEKCYNYEQLESCVLNLSNQSLIQPESIRILLNTVGYER